MPSATRPGKARQAARAKSGSFTAALPRMIRATPAASQASATAMVRMPPPSCTRAPGTAARMPRTASALAGLAREGAVQVHHMHPGEAGLR